MTGQNPEKSEVAKREEETLKFWRENKIFEKSLAKPSPKGEFVFYDGPPFATGLPHYGHLLTSIVKDVIPRYKTMQGYHVRRRWGWDTHGLPIENMIEKELGFKSKKDIEEIGVEKFNEACRAKVLEYANEWKKYVDRIGRWVDFDDAYMTMDATYTESVWWTLKEIYNKGLLYEGRKVLMYCPHCETPLSKAEIAMDNSYKDITEDAVLVEFGLTSDPKTSLLAWTTTPWTLPANVALAVHPEITYVTVEKKDMGNGELVRFVLAKERLENVFGAEEYKIVEERKGSELVGLEYTALFDVPKMASDKSYKVYAADFVNTYEGTGVVHTAVIYGEDDYQLGLKNDLPMVPLLNPNGTYNTDAPEFLQGQYIKKVDKMVIEDLEKRGFLFDKKANTHSYPHCYRCDTPLIYNALSSWFINIQKIKARMIELNEKINWVPEHLKHGRFLNIVENAPDWGISRNRYWASPLPIWKCSSCQDIKVVGSLEELRSKVTKSGNKYFLMRHGHSKGNPQKLVSIQGDENDFLTEEGKEQVRKSGEDLKSQNIDLIVHSPFTRIKESVNIVADILGLPKENVLGDERLHEFDARKFAGRPWSELWASEKDMDLYVSPGGAEESYALVRTRMIAALVDLESKYKGQNILIVSHDLPLLLLSAGHNALSHSDEVCNYESMPYFKNAEVREFNFLPLPRNMRGEIDLHRPYIDAIKLKCDCGGIMSRVPEVVDCWVESGCMPFAEYHYPFENKSEFEKRFPADFIVEYVAQTRTWFYYLLAISTGLFDSESFKNVICHGTILAADGSKMSKSKGNYTDPLLLVDKHGVDAIRYYLMTNVVMQGEDMNFRDDDVKEVRQRIVNIIWNVVLFYQMYVPNPKGNPRENPEGYPSSQNVLDNWILARLAELHQEVTENLDRFDTVRATRPLREFVNDLSTWYLRRSRDRFKAPEVSPPSVGGLSSGASERAAAISTTRFVLLEISKLLAPFMPFLADQIYKGVGGFQESVHLENWTLEFPKQKEHSDILKNMRITRDVVTKALEARTVASIKVRQPLSKLTISDKLGPEFLVLIKDEVNVKEVLVGTDFNLDATVTPELKLEGDMRDLVRQIQDKRKEMGLQPSAKIHLILPNSLELLVDKFGEEIKKSVHATEVAFGEVLSLEKV